MSAPQPPSQTRSHPTRPSSQRTTRPAAAATPLGDTDTHLIPLAPRHRSTSRRSSLATPPSDLEETRCWICFVSDSEEDVPRTDWKAPCRCSLVAHEACLLDWIADLQKTGRDGTGAGAGELACPQCKTPIRLREKESLVLDVVDRLGVLAGKAGAFVAFGGVGSVLFVGCTVYGVNTIYTICGPEYASEVLLGADGAFQWTWRLGVGLPLIPFVLIASRTRLFDSVLPVLPVIFFCHTDPVHFTLPPSPQIILALLPYLRSSYDFLWTRYIATHESRWVRETTPKFALEAEEQNAENRAAARRRNAPAAADAAPAEPQGWNGEVLVENHNVILQGNNVTSLVLGALLWPSVARLAGLGLARWGGARVRRWLPSALARNVVGGLMVVVLKDFIALYCKFKRAQKFRSRSVVDYVDGAGRGKGKGRAPTRTF
ncbi:hypothetical protein EDC01DRAFT_166404 [Geopyxis carbonaria]|nr:hypothetical protein EDC01DRAFT_166404 [Geopyxis carbonaria]